MFGFIDCSGIEILGSGEFVDGVDLILPERRDELVEDLRKRTGLDIRDIEIGQADFLKDTAWIKVTYELPAGQVNTIDKLTRTKDFNA